MPEPLVNVLIHAAKRWAKGTTQLKSTDCEAIDMPEPDAQKAMLGLARRGLVRNKKYDDGTLAIIFITKLGFQEIAKLRKERSSE